MLLLLFLAVKEINTCTVFCSEVWLGQNSHFHKASIYRNWLRCRILKDFWTPLVLHNQLEFLVTFSKENSSPVKENLSIKIVFLLYVVFLLSVLSSFCARSRESCSYVLFQTRKQPCKKSLWHNVHELHQGSEKTQHTFRGFVWSEKMLDSYGRHDGGGSILYVHVSPLCSKHGSEHAQSSLLRATPAHTRRGGSSLSRKLRGQNNCLE